MWIKYVIINTSDSLHTSAVGRLKGVNQIRERAEIFRVGYKNKYISTVATQGNTKPWRVRFLTGNKIEEHLVRKCLISKSIPCSFRHQI